LPCWAAEQIDGIPIIGSGECYLHIQSDGRYAMSEREAVTALYRYFIKKNITGIPGFFQYTPELMSSWLNHPRTKIFVQKGESSNSEILKSQIYEEQLGIQPRTKYNGYEKVFYEKKRIDEKLPYNLEVTWTPYADLLHILEYKV